jgi:hypothetical protein
MFARCDERLLSLNRHARFPFSNISAHNACASFHIEHSAVTCSFLIACFKATFSPWLFESLLSAVVYRFTMCYV